MERRMARAGTSGVALTITIVLASLWLWCTACTPAGELITPREVVVDGGVFPVTDMSVAVHQDSEEQVMEIIKNRFSLTITTSTPLPMLSMKVELQNIGVGSGNNINSIYFRTNAFPVDGNYYSLSGNPADPLQENAAKIIFYESGRFVPIVPKATSGAADNFQVSAYIDDNRTLHGIFLCTTTLPPLNRTVVVSGSFTTSY